jgi:zinc transport system ATP-binding protein
MPQTTPVLEVQNLYVSRNGEPVIENANFSVNQSDYVGIVGPNGGGKTTLLCVILNFLPLTKGTIRLFGEDISKFTSWEKIAYISQNATSFENEFPLTVRELVSLGCIRKGKCGAKV